MPPYYAGCKFGWRGDGPELSCNDQDVVQRCTGLKGFFGIGTNVTCPRADCNGEFTEEIPCLSGRSGISRTYKITRERLGIGESCPHADGFTETKTCPFDKRYERMPLHGRDCPVSKHKIDIDVPWLDAMYEKGIDECAKRCDDMSECHAFSTEEADITIFDKQYKGSCNFYQWPTCAERGTTYMKRLTHGTIVSFGDEVYEGPPTEELIAEMERFNTK